MQCFVRIWQDIPVLVIVSMLAYFSFLEQLLVSLVTSNYYLPSLSEFLISSCGQISKLGSGAIAISLPFSCILGLLASMTATTMGRLCILYFFILCVLGSCHLRVILIPLKFLCSKQKICLGLCSHSIWSSGSLWTYFLLTGKRFFDY